MTKPRTEKVDVQNIAVNKYRDIKFGLNKVYYASGGETIQAVLLGTREYAGHKTEACNREGAVKKMYSYIDDLINTGQVMTDPKFEKAKLAAMTSAVVLYNLVETFEQEVGVRIPMRVIDIMVKKNTDYLKSEHGVAMMERVKDHLNKAQGEDHDNDGRRVREVEQCDQGARD